MRLFLALALLSTFIFIACSQKPKVKKYTPDPKARQLVDSASKILMHSDDKEKAIALLDQATQIDSNYYLAFFNKLLFQTSLNLFNDALVTVKNLTRLRPQDADTYMTAGSTYWMAGDSLQAMNHFMKASNLFDELLDTMSTSNKSYQPALMDQAIALILIGKEEKGKKALTHLYNKQTNEDYKLVLKMFLGKSRKQLLDGLYKPDSTASESAPIIKE